MLSRHEDSVHSHNARNRLANLIKTLCRQILSQEVLAQHPDLRTRTASVTTLKSLLAQIGAGMSTADCYFNLVACAKGIECQETRQAQPKC